METKKINNNNRIKEEKLFKGVLLLNAKIIGLVLGLMFGLMLFVATNWLVIKGGYQIGPHLELLNQYFIGYSVSFWGSLVGFAYGFALGTLSGSLIGWIYNIIVKLRN